MTIQHAPERGLVRQESLDGTVVKRSAETAQAAAAEQSKAVVQARFLMAINRPRNYEDARLAILKTCERPTFAVKARYKKPQSGAKSCGRRDCPYGRGDFCGFICGLSIRAADEFAKFYGNIQTEQATLYDDEDQRIIGVAATDLEHNITKSVTITIKKTVERRQDKLNGRTPLAWRENSQGKPVAIVQATDDEVTQKEGAACAKARRNLLLQLVPADLLEEAEDLAFETVAKGIQDDPAAAKKNLIASFDRIGIKPSELERYLGHSLDGISVAEVADLQCVYSAVADKEAKWSDFLKASESDDDEEKSHLTAVKEKMREKIAKNKKKSVAPSQEDLDASPATDDFKSARSSLSAMYEGNERKIDDALFRNGADVDLTKIAEDCADEKTINAVIKTAGEMKR